VNAWRKLRFRLQQRRRARETGMRIGQHEAGLGKFGGQRRRHDQRAGMA
jgi:hypothetical protein